MAITSGYYNSRGGDRKYNAEDMSKYFAGLFTQGVLETVGDQMAVTATAGLGVSVGTGKAYFSDGKWVEITADVPLTLEAAPVVQSRIDRIVLRNDLSEDVRAASVYVLAGTPAEDPQPPELASGDDALEMSLARILVTPNMQSINQSSITDERPDSDLCGFVYALGQKVDIENLYLQHQAVFDEFMEDNEASFDAMEAAERARETAEGEREAAEELRQSESDRAVAAADSAAGRAQNAADAVDAQVAEAVSAADRAEDLAQSVRDDANSGLFNGAPGAPGAVGTLSPGMFMAQISQNGHLVLVHNADESAPAFALKQNGHLVYTIG